MNTETIEALNTELDDFPFSILRRLAEAHLEDGNTKLATGYRWLVTQRKKPDEFKQWFHDSQSTWETKVPDDDSLPPLPHGKFDWSREFESLAMAYEYAATFMGNYLAQTKNKAQEKTT